MNTFIKNNVKRFLFILLFSFFVSGCVKLEEESESFITSEQFYKTKEDAVSAVTSIYNHLNHNTSSDHASIYNRLLVLTVEMQTDDHLPGPRATNSNVRSLAVLTHSATNNRIDELWKQLYEGVTRANLAIDKIPGIKASSSDNEVLNRLVLEAKFLRALFYFNLVRLWGDVPLVIHSPETVTEQNQKPARAAKAEVYTQILTDLRDAEGLPASYSSTDAGRVTSGAARALEVEVYITLKEWNNALTKVDELNKAPYQYDLFTNYADVFNPATKNGIEHIFSVQSKGFNNGNATILGQIAAPATIPGIAGSDADAPHDSLLKVFRKSDKRYAVTFYDSLISPKDGKTYRFKPHFGKYWDPAAISNPAESSVNIPILRYADILLYQAEALNESQGPTDVAYRAINKIRFRAGLPDLPQGLTQEQFRDSVYKERRLEFVYENKRWFDLVRTKRLISALKAAGKSNVAEKHYLLPLPQREYDLNPNLRPQNPGWE